MVTSACAGQAWAQQALFERHAPMALGLANRFLPREEDVDDLVQDCFFYAFRQLNALQDPGAFGGWLGTIVVRTAGKRYRRQRLAQKLGIQAGRPLDVERAESRSASPDIVAQLRTVCAAIDRFPPMERTALLLRRIEGLKHEEIAQRIGVSESTVKRKLRLAKARLARLAQR